MDLNFSRRNILEIEFDKEFDLPTKEALKAYYEWVIPAAQTLINKEFTLVRNEDSLIISAEKTIKNFFSTHSVQEVEWYKGLFKYLNTTPRGEIVGVSQNKAPNFSALVPLILAAFKMYRNVNYSEWDFTDKFIKVFVDADLFDSISLGSDLVATREELIQARDYTCLVKSGKKIGSKTKPTSQYSVSSKSFERPELNNLPRLRKVIDCQLWVAHPSLRTKYMILDTINLDSMPEPLLDSEINFEPKLKKTEEDIWDPWKELS